MRRSCEVSVLGGRVGGWRGGEARTNAVVRRMRRVARR